MVETPDLRLDNLPPRSQSIAFVLQCRLCSSRLDLLGMPVRPPSYAERIELVLKAVNALKPPPIAPNISLGWPVKSLKGTRGIYLDQSV